MSTEHAVDPSTLDPETWVEVRHEDQDSTYVTHPAGVGRCDRIVAVLHRAGECPPAEQWRQVTPEEVREGWLVERRKGDSRTRGRVRGFAAGGWIYDTDGSVVLWGDSLAPDWTLWTNEPADPDAERRRLIEAATGRNADTLEANLAEYGLAIVEVDRGE